MNSDDLARRIVARFDPVQAERLLAGHLRDFGAALADDLIARPEVYRTAVEDGLPELSVTQADYLRRVWADIEYRLERGSEFSAPTPYEADLEVDEPYSSDWFSVLVRPLVTDASSGTLNDLSQLSVQAGWYDASGHQLIDIAARIKELD
jgi:hypothetical protein